MRIDPDWISAGAESVIALGLILTWWQVRNDHERSRREKAIDLIFSWASANNRQSVAARKFGEELTFQEGRAIFLQQPVKLDRRLKDLLESILDSELVIEGDEIAITTKQSSELRDHIAAYLNNLEGVLAAWRHNVADREIISEQFRGFISQQNKVYLLENFRDAAGGKRAYPAIGQFVRQVRDEEEAADRGKAKIF